MTGTRERARAATTAEILRLAREQLAAEGAAALSLRAIARDLGMVSSGIYRYYTSRDELLTALIIDSYNRLGDTVEQADASVRRRGDLAARWKAAATSIREWAIAHPSEWALLFGTPVPGYAAPEDTIGPAGRYTLVLVRLLADMVEAGRHHTTSVPRSLRPDLARLRASFVAAVPDSTLAAGLTAWGALIGTINLELFGHLHNVVDAPGALYEAVVEQHGQLLLAPRELKFAPT
jgi:AcrR family transcriptional regulator